jgi:hypothetical protein
MRPTHRDERRAVSRRGRLDIAPVDPTLGAAVLRRGSMRSVAGVAMLFALFGLLSLKAIF